MAKLFGAQKLVLQAIQDSPRDAAGFVSDTQVAQSTSIDLKDVRDWLETLEGEGLIDVARITQGLRVAITARGRLQLDLFDPTTNLHGSPASAGSDEVSRPDMTPEENSESIGSVAVEPPSHPFPRSPISRPGTATPPTSDVDGFQVVLLIHGIRTQAEWGPMVASRLEIPGRIKVIPIRYGYFDAFRFWFPFWTRNRQVEKVYVQMRVALQKYRRKHPNAKLSIVAHSFGTYVVGEILKRDFELKIHRLILCGSVLPQDFPWEQYQGRFDDEKSINECGKSDIWPVLAQSASWGYGASGTHGFSSDILIANRFHAGGHGQYFEPEFVEEYWEPFIRRGEYKATEFERKMRPTPWWISILGILPLKWLIVILLAVSLAFAGRYVIAAMRGLQPVPTSTEKAATRGLDLTKSAEDVLEISSFDFSEEYVKAANRGGMPQLDLILRNATSQPVVITGIRFNVKKVWKLEPTPMPLSSQTAEVLLPSAVYDVVAGGNQDEDSAVAEPAKVTNGQLSVGSLGINKDPKIETHTKKVSHYIQSGKADRILLNYSVVREMGRIDPSTSQPVVSFMICPFYLIRLSISVIYNNGKEIESKDLGFINYYNTINEQSIANGDTKGDFFGISRKDRIQRNLAAIREIEGLNILKSPSVQSALSLTKKLAEDDHAASDVDSTKKPAENHLAIGEVDLLGAQHQQALLDDLKDRFRTFCVGNESSGPSVRRAKVTGLVLNKESLKPIKGVIEIEIDLHHRHRTLKKDEPFPGSPGLVPYDNHNSIFVDYDLSDPKGTPTSVKGKIQYLTTDRNLDLKEVPNIDLLKWNGEVFKK